MNRTAENQIAEAFADKHFNIVFTMLYIVDLINNVSISSNFDEVLNLGMRMMPGATKLARTI